MEGKIRSGHFATAEQVVAEGLRFLQEQDEFLALHRDAIKAKIAAGVESLLGGDSIDGEDAFEILERELSEVVRPDR